MGGDANVLDQRARRPLRAQSGSTQSCRQPITAPSHPPRPRAGCWDRVRPRRTPGNRTTAAALRSVPARCRAVVGQHAGDDATSSRRARRMVTAAMAVIEIPVEPNTRASGRGPVRTRRSSAATRHSRRGESRLHAPRGYRPAVRRRRARFFHEQKPRPGQLMLHPRQRGIAAPDLVGVEIGCRLAQISHLEAAHREIGLMAVLLQNSHSSIFAAQRRRPG